jgi:hypothetical protein
MSVDSRQMNSTAERSVLPVKLSRDAVEPPIKGNARSSCRAFVF